MAQECGGSMGTKSQYQSVSSLRVILKVFFFKLILKVYKKFFHSDSQSVILSKCYSPFYLKLLNASQVLPRCSGNFHMASVIANPHSIQSACQLS